MTKPKINPKVILLLGVTSASLAGIFVRYANAPSMAVAAWRMCFSALLVLPVILVKFRGELRHLSLKSLLSCMLSGVFLAAHFSTYFESVYHASVLASTVLANMEPLFVVLMSWLLWRQAVSRKGIVAICITFAGMAIVALGDGGNGQGGGSMYGQLMGVAAAFFMSVYTMIGSRQRQHVSTTVYTFIVYLSSAVTLVVACLVTGTPLTGYAPITPLMGLAMAVFCTLLGHSIFSWSLKYLETAFVSTTKLAGPIAAALLALLFFREVPTVATILGGIIILCGIGLYFTVAQAPPQTITEAKKENAI